MKTDSKTILRALEQYGFTSNEAGIYLFLLKRLEATAFEIAKETEIPRTTVYQTIEKLKNQGIISQFKKNNIAYFTPENPSRLLRLLKEKESILNSVMPDIQAIIAREMDTPITKLYIGTDGMKTVFDDILQTLKDQKIKQIYATSQPELLEYLPKYFPNWLSQREELGVFTRLILPSSAKGFLPANAMREVRFLPQTFPFDCCLLIYGKKVAFFAFQEGEPYAVSVEGEAIANMLTQFFRFTWEMLGKQE